MVKLCIATKSVFFPPPLWGVCSCVDATVRDRANGRARHLLHGTAPLQGHRERGRETSNEVYC